MGGEGVEDWIYIYDLTIILSMVLDKTGVMEMGL
jgi:dTDP-D-glucose 4,6-dehydratase